MPTDTRCLFSTVKNTTHRRQKFGFLPPHGRELDSDEEFTVFGNILEAVQGIERVTSRRSMLAFEDAVDAGAITILSTPAPIFFDPDNNEPRMIIVEAGNLATTDPCWGSASI